MATALPLPDHRHRAFEALQERLQGSPPWLAALRRLGRPTEEAEAAVAYHKEREAEPAIAGKWLQENPLENLAAQPRWEFRAEGAD